MYKVWEQIRCKVQVQMRYKAQKQHYEVQAQTQLRYKVWEQIRCKAQNK